MSDPILDVQDLVGGYGKMTILNGTTFSGAAGTITTVIGPNGAGKSTVFKAIFGLLKLREGKVMLRRPRRHQPEPARAAQPPASATCRRAATSFPSSRCATTSSSAALPPGTGIDLPSRIEAALDQFPVLRRKATQQASTLSGGEQKQLEIARACCSNRSSC